MQKYVRFSSGKIINKQNKRVVKLDYLCKLFYQKKNFELLEAYTLKDIKEETLNKFLEKKKLNAEAKAEAKAKAKSEAKASILELYGPETPIYETKLNKCSSCSNTTPNRFKCARCWDSVPEYYAGDFIYHLV